MGTIANEAGVFAKDIIDLMLQAHGQDYSAQKAFIETWVEENMWRGTWDLTIEFETGGHRDLRLIQEDEYDQHMDEDEDRPEHDIGYIDGYYVFFAD